MGTPNKGTQKKVVFVLFALTDGGRESVPFLQLDFCHLDYEDDLQSLRNSNIT